MAIFNIAMTSYGAADHKRNRSTLQQQLTLLREAILIAFDGLTHPYEFYIFLASEFYFSNNQFNHMQPYSAREKRLIYSTVTELSRLRPNFLLVGGSILWSQHKFFSHEVMNTAPVACNGNLILKHKKQVPGGEIPVQHEKQIFVPGKESALFNYYGLTVGLEVCMEHAIGNLAENKIPLDIQLVIGDAVTPEPKNIILKNRGLHIHCNQGSFSTLSDNILQQKISEPNILLDLSKHKIKTSDQHRIATWRILR